jgi:hypothetical protein
LRVFSLEIEYRDVSYSRGDISKELGFEDGSAQKIALHAAAGALTAVVSGGNIGLGAFAGGSQELIGAVVGKALMDNPNLTQEERNALSQWASVLVGMAAGGGQGAAIALDAETFNRQLHIEEAKLIEANAPRYAVQQGYCADVSSCSVDAVDVAIEELIRQTIKQVDITGANYLQNDAASSFLDSIAPKGSIPGFCNAGSVNCGQTYSHASGDAYRDSWINSDFFKDVVKFYDLASRIYNQEHVTQIDIAGSLFRQAELVSGIHAANSGVDQAMLPWDVFNGIFAGVGGPFAIKQRLAEQEAAQGATSGAKPPLSPTLQQAISLFSKSSGVLTIGSTVFAAVPNRGNAAIFTGASDAQINQFFLELTGASVMPAPRIIPGKGTLYVISTPGGSFNLRDFSSSSEQTGPAWTIDLPKGAVGMTYNPEIKFLKGGNP